MNLQYQAPIISRDLNTDVVTAVTADEVALGQSTANTSTFCDISLTALTTPPTPTATFAAGGTAGQCIFGATCPP